MSFSYHQHEYGEGQYSPLQGATFDLQEFAANMVARGKSSPLCFALRTHLDVRVKRIPISASSSLKRRVRRLTGNSGDRLLPDSSEQKRLTRTLEECKKCSDRRFRYGPTLLDPET
jgi:hypothetical protein